jgi:hypothetical protein
MGVVKRVMGAVDSVLRFVGRLCFAWMRFVARIILLFWHFGS